LPYFASIYAVNNIVSSIFLLTIFLTKYIFLVLKIKALMAVTIKAVENSNAIAHA